MRIAHIILAHKNPMQVARLIRTMQHEQFDFYVHVDNRIDLKILKRDEELAHVKFIKPRVACNWGGYSILKAIFNSLNEVLASEQHYDFINLLSGQDYPIMSSDKIYGFFSRQKGKNFISYDSTHDSAWWQNANSRYEKYHLTDFNIKGKYFVEKILNTIAPVRKFPGYRTLFGGNKSTWWTISSDCALYLNKTFKENARLRKFLRFCWGTDEFVIPTLIMNSSFKDSVVNNNLRYIDWSEGNDSPKLFDVSDFNNISRSEMHFARKFDLDHDVHILNMIDEQLLIKLA